MYSFKYLQVRLDYFFGQLVQIRNLHHLAQGAWIDRKLTGFGRQQVWVTMCWSRAYLYFTMFYSCSRSVAMSFGANRLAGHVWQLSGPNLWSRQCRRRAARQQIDVSLSHLACYIKKQINILLMSIIKYKWSLGSIRYIFESFSMLKPCSKTGFSHHTRTFDTPIHYQNLNVDCGH